MSKKKTYSDKLKDPRWQKKRLKILERDNFSCVACGDEETELHVNHLKYTGEPHEAPDEDLETLCKHCHKLHHILIDDCIFDVVKKHVKDDDEILFVFKYKGHKSIHLVVLLYGITVKYIVFQNGSDVIKSINELNEEDRNGE